MIKTVITISCVLALPLFVVSNGCYDYYRTRLTPYDMYYLDTGRALHERSLWFFGVRFCSSMDSNRRIDEARIRMDEIMPQIKQLKQNMDREK